MSVQSTAIVDKLLTNVSQQIVPEGYISEMILTPATGTQFTGKIGKYGNGHLRIVTTITGGREKFPHIETNTRSSDTYEIQTHGLAETLTKEDFANVEKPFDARKDATNQLTHMMWTVKEKALADTLADTGILTNNTTLSGTDQWDDAASDPLGDFITARDSIQSKTGQKPNKAIMSFKVADTLRYHADLLDRMGFKDQRPGGLNDQELAKALDVKTVLVGSAVFNSAKLGQTDVIANVWDTICVFMLSPDSAALRQKTFGYEVSLKGTSQRQMFKNKQNSPPESELIQIRSMYDQLVTDVGAAFLIKDAIS